MFINDKTDPARLEKGRWVTLALQIILGSALTLPYILAIYVGPLHETRGWSIGMILMTFTVGMWVGSPAQIIGGIIRDRIGNRATIVFSGIVYGLAIIISGYVTNVVAFIILQGIVASTVLFIANVAQYQNIGALFPDYRGMTLGLLAGGVSIGTAVMSPLAMWMIETFSCSSSLLFQGILYGGICVVFGFLIVNAPDEGFTPKGWDEEKVKAEDEGIALEKGHLGIEMSWKDLFKTPTLYLLWAGLAATVIVCFGLSSNLSLMAQDATGMSEMKAAWLYSLYSVALGIGGIVMGFVADKLGAIRCTILMAAIEGIMLLALAITGGNSVAAFTILAVVTGCAFGAYTTTIGMITMNFFGVKNFGVNFGIIQLQALLSSTIGPWLTYAVGLKSYFLINAVLSIGAIFLLLAAKKSVISYAKKHSLLNGGDGLQEEPVDEADVQGTES